MLRDGVTLYYVRHGETDWNVVQRYQGQSDVPLNDTGRTQAARNGRMLRELLGAEAGALDYVASPLARTSETMQIARREMGLEPDTFRRDERLMEQCYGVWEGKTWAELPRLDPEGFKARLADKWGWCPEGGESYRMLTDRIAGWVAEVRRDAVVVSHGAVSRALRGIVLSLDGPSVTELPVPQDRVMVLRRGFIDWR